ncbi:MAG: hypothetical protein ACKVI8_06945 [Paraglaciecola sp.]
MIIRAYTGIVFSGLVLLGCIALGVITYNEPRNFERASFLFLIFTAYVCKHDKDLLSVIGILAISYFIDHLMLLAAENLTWWNFIMYQCAAAIIFTLWRDKLSKLSAIVLALVVLAEIYWGLTNYQKPDLSLAVGKLAFALIVRHVFIHRPDYIERFFNYDGDYIAVDKKFRDLYAVYILIEIANIAEYLIRHTTQYKPLIVYQTYPFIIQIISTLSLWFVLHYSQKTWLKKTLKA